MRSFEAVSVQREEVGNSGPLTANECHFMLTYDPPVYCRGPVAGIYCATHTAIARKEEEKRFAKARTR